MSLRLSVLPALVAVALVIAYAAAPRAALALIAGSVLAILAARRPRDAVTLLFVGGAVLLDFSPLPVYRYFLLSDLLMLAACVSQLWLDRSIVLRVPALLTMLCVVYLTALLLTFGVSRDYSGFSNWLHFAFLMLVYVPLMTTLFIHRPDLRGWLVGAIVATALAQSLVLFVEIARGLDWSVGTRIPGALGTTGLWNYVAAVVALTGLAVMARWPVPLWAVGALSIIALAEMFLRSRMLWLSSILGASLMFSLSGKSRMRGVIFAAAVLAVLSVGYLAQLYPEAIQRRIAETLRPTETSDLVARLQVVKDLAGAIEQSGGLGIGVGQSEAYLRDHHSTAQVVSIHNVVLHAAVEGGVLAAASIILLPVAIAVLWRAALRRVRVPEDSFLLNWQIATLLAIYVGAQLTPTLYEHTFYAIIAALAATAVEVDKRVTDPSLFELLDRFARGHRTRVAA